MCFVVIVLGKAVYFFSPWPLSKSRLAVKKAQSVITDVAKLDVVSDGLLRNQLLNFCQNTRMAFLGRNTHSSSL